MNIIKFNPTYVPTVRNQFGGFFDDFLTRDWVQSQRALPAVNVYENDTEFRLEVASVGFQKDDFKLHLQDKKLKISAEKKVGTENAEEKFVRREFGHTKFARTFILPKNVDAENIGANYADGILKVILPKVEPETPNQREIDIL